MKTTKKDFIEFKEECKRLISVLGLSEWSCVFKHCKLDNDSARISYNTQDRVAIFFLNKKVDELWDGGERSARHEIGHLLIADLDTMAGYGEASRLVQQESEKFANRFANLIEFLEERGE
ncbi:MAG TPA: hypothetical protein ENH24_02635 [Nitrospirae bacterium]|nr:hypothetical protein [Nitrospirota bacterium]